MSTAFDYNSILDRLVASLEAKQQGARILFSSANQKLLSVVAQELAYGHSNSEYLSRENQWNLARNSSSLLTQAPVHGYVPPRKIGATGDIAVSTSENFDTAPTTEDVLFPQYTTFSNSAGTKFVTLESATLSAGVDAYTHIPVMQGIKRTLSIVGTGNDFETITINNGSIENTIFEVRVNGVLWEAIDYSIFQASANELKYEVRTLRDFSGVRIRFGNGYFGKKITNGYTIEVTYFETEGASGDVLEAGNVTIVDDTIYDAVGDPVTVYCTNAVITAEVDTAVAEITGGQDEVDTETIRATSPLVFQTGDRATGKDDYKVILEQLSYIKKVVCWGVHEVNEDLGRSSWTYVSAEENKVHLACISSTDENLTTSQKEGVASELYRKKNPTSVLTFDDVIFINLVFNVDAKILNRTYTSNQVVTTIRNGLISQYSIDNTEFEANLYSSDVISYIDSLAGVSYHDLTMEIANFATFSSAYASSLNMYLYPINGASIKLYVKNPNEAGYEDYVLIGTSTSSGYLEGEAGYDLTGSQINTANGEGSLNVVSGLSGTYSDYQVKVLFQLTSPNLVLRNRQSIVKYYDSVITATY